MTSLRGALTALITPMKEDGAVDYDGIRRLIEFQLEAGIDGLLPLGTTGETPTLLDEEERDIIALVVKEVNGRVPVIVGAGSNSTTHMAEYTRRARDLGADAALVVTPYYNKPNDSGLLAHFEEAASVGLPIVVYNIASRTGRNIPPPLMRKIAAIPGIAGVKEASGDLGQAGDMIHAIAAPEREEGREFAMLCGDDALTLPFMSLGGDGVVSVVSNLFPRKTAALVRHCLEGEFASARRLHYELLPFVKAAFVETNPAPIKQAMTWSGLPGGPTRLPLGALAPQSEAVLRAALEAVTASDRYSETDR